MLKPGQPLCDSWRRRSRCPCSSAPGLPCGGNINKDSSDKADAHRALLPTGGSQLFLGSERTGLSPGCSRVGLEFSLGPVRTVCHLCRLCLNPRVAAEVGFIGSLPHGLPAAQRPLSTKVIRTGPPCMWDSSGSPQEPPRSVVSHVPPVRVYLPHPLFLCCSTSSRES